MSARQDEGERLFREGYNCSQAVLAVFCCDGDLDLDAALKLSAAFGGGLARRRLTCGAVTGMCMAAGLLFARPDPDGRADIYAAARELCAEFERRNGSLICAELLSGLHADGSPVPAPRTEAYYKKRPCVELVRSAVGILEEYAAMREKK